MIRPSLRAAALVAPAVLLAGAGSVSAKGTFESNWRSQYPTSLSADNVINGTGKVCQLCHQAANGGDGWNGYGWDIKKELDLGASIDAALAAIEALDSDADVNGGTANIDEIAADSQPGWTDGENNAIYFKDGTVVFELAPGGIANLDPGAPNAAPVADAGGPYSGTVGVAVTFSGTGADPDGDALTYAWDFGDGNTGTGAVASNTYAAAGTYNVTLTVTDPDGATGADATTATIGVGNQAPVADAGGPYSATVGDAVNFDGSASADPDGSIVAYDWSFGDGGTGAGVAPSYTYAAAGTYNVTLTVTDDAGASDSQTTSAEIADVPPPPSAADLDITAFRVGKRASLRRGGEVGLKVVVANPGTADASGIVQVSGVQGATSILFEQAVTVAAGGKQQVKFNYVASDLGTIQWTATVTDEDPDVDEATAVTEIVK